MAVREAGREINVDCVNEQKKNQNILLAHALGKSEIWLERQAKEKWNSQRSIKQLWDFPGGPPAVADSALPLHRAWVQSLIRKLDPTCRN